MPKPVLSQSLIVETGFDHLDSISSSVNSLPEFTPIDTPTLPNTGTPTFPESPGNNNLSRSANLSPRPKSSRQLSFIRPFKQVKQWIRSKPDENYRIEYSVLQSSNPITEVEFNESFELSKNLNYYTLGEFNRLINSVIEYIDIYKPQRISQGSSGSYFIKIQDSNGNPIKVGVFKPKDEEPYGPSSPKWSKWFHRTFFPFWFGRSCLLLNQGYISEAMASYVDQRLLSFIVPYTDIIYLKSSLFYFPLWDRINKRVKPKIGSFQKFIDYQQADKWLALHPFPKDSISQLPVTSYINKSEPLVFYWSQETLMEFQVELEKLVIFDYLIRNTDRSLDNWMIKLEWQDNESYFKPILKIGAIDSGLAFPWKHPDEWRSFPYGWLFLPYPVIGQLFSSNLREHYIRILSSSSWWENTVLGLKKISKKDKNFKLKYFNRQISVLKGQAFNIIEVLKVPGSTPLDLAKRLRVTVVDEVRPVPNDYNNQRVEEIDQRFEDVVFEKLIFENKDPVFTCC